MNRAGRIAEEQWSQEFHFVSFSFYARQPVEGLRPGEQCQKAATRQPEAKISTV
jgi:hypothetical protein